MKIDIVFLVILGFMVLRTICNNKRNIKEQFNMYEKMNNLEITSRLMANEAIVNNINVNKVLNVGGINIINELNSLKASVAELKLKNEKLI